MACTGHKGLQVVGYGWERHERDWTRWLIRRCKECKQLRIEELIWVDFTYPVCLACLSQTVTDIPDFQSPRRYFCHACGATTWVRED